MAAGRKYTTLLLVCTVRIANIDWETALAVCLLNKKNWLSSAWI